MARPTNQNQVFHRAVLYMGVVAHGALLPHNEKVPGSSPGVCMSRNCERHTDLVDWICQIVTGVCEFVSALSGLCQEGHPA